MATEEVEVLVTIGDNKREVKFSGSYQDLLVEIKKEFADILTEEIKHLQIYKKKWESFVDLKPTSTDIADGSKLQVILKKRDSKSAPVPGPTPTSSPPAEPVLVDPPEGGCKTCYEPPASTRQTDSDETGQGAIFPFNRLWDKTTLKVCFLNQIPTTWTYSGHKNIVPGGGSSHVIDHNDILTLANHWSTKLPASIPKKRREKVPKFVPVSNPKDSDIRVWFRENGGCCTEIGTSATTKPNTSCKEECATMHLDLGGSDSYKEHLVMHEFGHALGLGHEHQQAVFWKTIGKFFKPCALKNFFGEGIFKRDVESFEGSMPGQRSEYDPDSIMHYWFHTSWLKDKYNTLEKVNALPTKVNPWDKGITDEEKKILKGLFKRMETLAEELSETDLEWIVKVYNVPADELVEQDGPVHKPMEQGGSRPTSEVKSEGTLSQDKERNMTSKYSLSFDTEGLVAWLRVKGLDKEDCEKIRNAKFCGRSFVKINDEQHFKEMEIPVGCRLLFEDLIEEAKEDISAAEVIATVTAEPPKPAFLSTSLSSNNLSKELEGLIEWKRFGIALNIPIKALETIERNRSQDLDGRKLALFAYIERNYKTLGITWDDICNALEGFEGNLAYQLRMKYCSGSRGKLVSNGSKSDFTAEDPTRLGPVHLKAIQEATFDARNKWKALGVQLEVDYPTLESIEIKNRGTPDDCYRALLEAWLQRDNPKPTISALMDALRAPSLNLGYLASKIKDFTEEQKQKVGFYL